jgi:hypothetical protein
MWPMFLSLRLLKFQIDDAVRLDASLQDAGIAFVNLVAGELLFLCFAIIRACRKSGYRIERNIPSRAGISPQAGFANHFSHGNGLTQR